MYLPSIAMNGNLSITRYKRSCYLEPMSEKYTLYGAQLSLYTGKVRAYLNYKNIPYDEVFSSLKVYKNIIVPKTGVRFIPVLKTPENEYLQDTAVIIDRMESSFCDNPIIPTTPHQQLVSYLFEIWADEWLLIAAMHYRWNHPNFPFIYQEFGRIVAPNMPAFIRRYLGKKVGSRFQAFVPMLGITERTIPAIEDWYENHVLACLDSHFAKFNYLLGGKPSLGDFCLMGPLYAHLYRDPASGDIMRNKAPHVAKWVERMNANDQPLTDWCADDEIPETLLPILTRMFAEFWPVLTNTIFEIEEWSAQYPNEKKLPRSIGNHRFSIGNQTEQRAISTFHQWKAQRVLDCYEAFNGEDKARLDEWLKQLGGLESLQFKVRKRVTRENNRLVFV